MHMGRLPRASGCCSAALWHGCIFVQRHSEADLVCWILLDVQLAPCVTALINSLLRCLCIYRSRPQVVSSTSIGRSWRCSSSSCRCCLSCAVVCSPCNGRHGRGWCSWWESSRGASICSSGSWQAVRARYACSAFGLYVILYCQRHDVSMVLYAGFAFLFLINMLCACNLRL